MVASMIAAAPACSSVRIPPGRAPGAYRCTVCRMAGDRDVTPEQAEALRREQDAQLIDVREDHEWDAGRIDGARHIVLGEVASQASTIDQDRPVVFYCRVGSRSAMAADAFRTRGLRRLLARRRPRRPGPATAARSSPTTARSRTTRCAALALLLRRGRRARSRPPPRRPRRRSRRSATSPRRPTWPPRRGDGAAVRRRAGGPREGALGRRRQDRSSTSARSRTTTGNERGLLSIAFPPDYATQRALLRLPHGAPAARCRSTSTAAPRTPTRPTRPPAGW